MFMDLEQFQDTGFFDENFLFILKKLIYAEDL